MAKRLGLLFVLVALLAGGPAAAEICTIDDVPAATLLLPYFEVDLDDPWGINTLFSINNASATAVLAHVTVWSDQSVPVLDFDVYLTGFDVITISLRDILVFRNLPVTASAGQDTAGDTISNQGAISQDVNFASCNGVLPYQNPAISTSFQAHLQAWLTGNQSPVTGNCAGGKNGDRIARGYVTVDTVNACNLLFPSQLAAGYDAVLTDQNVLWGDSFYVYDEHELAQGETLVHVESCPTCFSPGDHTFYGRYASATAIDAREPLPTTLATRFVENVLFDDGTDLLVWREGDQSAAGFACNLPGPPSWHPLPLTQVIIFDEDENPVQTEDCPSGDPTCEQEVGIPDEAQRVGVSGDLLAPFDFGWIYLNLQHPEIIAAYGDDDAQAWVTAAMEAEGRFALALDAVQLDNACTPNTLVLPVP